MDDQDSTQDQVKIFSTSSCVYCVLLKGYLKEKEVKFEEILVDQDHEGMHEFIHMSEGFNGVPFTVISKRDGNIVKIRGFDKSKFDEALDLKN